MVSSISVKVRQSPVPFAIVQCGVSRRRILSLALHCIIVAFTSFHNSRVGNANISRYTYRRQSYMSSYCCLHLRLAAPRKSPLISSWKWRLTVVVNSHYMWLLVGGQEGLHCHLSLKIFPRRDVTLHKLWCKLGDPILLSDTPTNEMKAPQKNHVSDCICNLRYHLKLISGKKTKWKTRICGSNDTIHRRTHLEQTHILQFLLPPSTITSATNLVAVLVIYLLEAGVCSI